MFLRKTCSIALAVVVSSLCHSSGGLLFVSAKIFPTKEIFHTPGKSFLVSVQDAENYAVYHGEKDGNIQLLTTEGETGYCTDKVCANDADYVYSIKGRHQGRNNFLTMHVNGFGELLEFTVTCPSKSQTMSFTNTTFFECGDIDFTEAVPFGPTGYFFFECNDSLDPWEASFEFECTENSGRRLGSPVPDEEEEEDDDATATAAAAANMQDKSDANEDRDLFLFDRHPSKETLPWTPPAMFLVNVKQDFVIYHGDQDGKIVYFGGQIMEHAGYCTTEMCNGEYFSYGIKGRKDGGHFSHGGKQLLTMYVGVTVERINDYIWVVCPNPMQNITIASVNPTPAATCGSFENNTKTTGPIAQLDYNCDDDDYFVTWKFEIECE